MSKNSLETRYLKSEELAILKECMADPFFFSKFIFVVNPVLGKTQFDLYPYQKALLYKFYAHRFNIVLKFRQAGITELIALYCLWLAMYHSNKNILILSIKERVAKKVLRKIKYMYQNLPDFLKVKIVNGRSGELGTQTEIEFSNGSMISSLATTEDSGRSEGVSLLVIDEAAIIRWANQIWAAAWPTLSTGGSAIINSTPYGVGNWYHKLWVSACSGGNPFNASRLYWRMHPDRDDHWYKMMADSLGPRKTAQEIDGDFLTSGHTVFDLTDIRAIEEDLMDMQPIRKLMNDCLWEWEEPVPGEQYCIGADVAIGRSQDYSTFTLNNKHGDDIVVFKQRISVEKFADLLATYGKRYNNALIAPESNDIGLAVTSLLQAKGYPNIYFGSKLVKHKGERKPREETFPGWLTTSKTRPVIIDELETDIRNNNILIRDPWFLQEAYTFIYDSANRPVAMGKSNRSSSDDLTEDSPAFSDDAIMGKAIANHVRKGKLKNILIAPQ